MFSLFTSNTEKKADFSHMKADMHNHVLPGVDDGARDLETSLEMLKIYKRLGFEKVVATPHVNEIHYPNVKQDLQEVFEYLKGEVEREGMNIHLELAAEYKTDDMFKELLEKDELLPLKGQYILIELPFLQEQMGWEEMLFQIQMKGYKVILAHAERYPYLFSRKEVFQSLADRDVELQLNLGSVTGRYGHEIQKMAGHLLKKGLYLWTGTDAHRPADLLSLEKKILPSWPKALEIKRNTEI